MKLQVLQKKTNENLALSTRIRNKIYFVLKNMINIKEISNYDETIRLCATFDEKITGIFSLNNSLVLLFGNEVRVCEIGTNTLHLKDVFLLSAIPLHYFSKNNAMYFISENKIEIKTNKLREINLDIKIKAAFVDDDNSYFIANCDEVYHTESIFIAPFVDFKAPLKRIPCNKNKNFDSIYALGNKIYLGSKDSFEVYEKNGNFLIQNYTYSGENIKLVISNKNMYCIGENLLKINDAPVLVYDTKINNLFEDLAISEKLLIFIVEDDITYSESKHEFKLLNELNVNDRIEVLINPLVNINFDVQDEENGLDELKNNILEKCNEVFFELKTTLESFDDKDKIL